MNFAPLILVIAVFGLMWLLILRPQQHRVRQHEALVASLGVGDRVISTGGLLGTIRGLDDDVVILEIADGVQIRLARAAVGQRLSEEEWQRVETDAAPADAASADAAPADAAQADTP